MYKERLESMLHTAYHRENTVSYTHWAYEDGVLMKALQSAKDIHGLGNAYEFIEDYIGHYIKEDGDLPTVTKRRPSVDALNNGKIILALHKYNYVDNNLLKSNDSRNNETPIASNLNSGYEKQLQILLEAIKIHPRLENSKGFAHKEVYDNQMWLDGLYMLQPLYCELSHYYGLDDNFSDIAE